jgi:excisionase family DNA binding protein
VAKTTSIKQIKPLVVSVAEAATMLNLSRAMIYKLIEAGAFPLKKIGMRSVIPVAALEDYIANCPVGVGEFPKKKSAPPPITASAEQSAAAAESVA